MDYERFRRVAMFTGAVFFVFLLALVALTIAANSFVKQYNLEYALWALGIGLLIILYARYYLSANEKAGRFYAYLLLFMGAMLGVVTSARQAATRCLCP